MVLEVVQIGDADVAAAADRRRDPADGPCHRVAAAVAVDGQGHRRVPLREGDVLDGDVLAGQDPVDRPRLGLILGAGPLVLPADSGPALLTGRGIAVEIGGVCDALARRAHQADDIVGIHDADAITQRADADVDIKCFRASGDFADVFCAADGGRSTPHGRVVDFLFAARVVESDREHCRVLHGYPHGGHVIVGGDRYPFLLRCGRATQSDFLGSGHFVVAFGVEGLDFHPPVLGGDLGFPAPPPKQVLGERAILTEIDSHFTERHSMPPRNRGRGSLVWRSPPG